MKRYILAEKVPSQTPVREAAHFLGRRELEPIKGRGEC